MAKQTRIDGTFDEVPAEVQQKVDAYVDTLRKRQKLQQKENTLRDELKELMHEYDVHEVELEDDKVLLLVEGDEKLKIKKRSEATAAANGEAE